MDTVKADTRLKDFWRNNERFADLFNAVLFGGKEVIRPETLVEKDTDVSGIIRFQDQEESVVRIRDVVKKSTQEMDFVVLGIENQQKTHYAMPLRTMLYDALGYLKEYQELTQTRKKEKGKMTEEEFLSKMRRDDRLHPVLTVVVYYGEDAWDGPHSLKEMLRLPKELEAVVADYPMHLLQVRDSGRFVFHNADVQTVLELSREIFAGNFQKIRESYGNREIERELAAVIGAITQTPRLITKAESEKEEINMCRSLENLVEKSREEGVAQGVTQGIEQGIEQGITQGFEQGTQRSIEKLLNKGYSAEDVADMLDLTLDEVQMVQTQLQK